MHAKETQFNFSFYFFLTINKANKIGLSPRTARVGAKITRGASLESINTDSEDLALTLNCNEYNPNKTLVCFNRRKIIIRKTMKIKSLGCVPRN